MHLYARKKKKILINLLTCSSMVNPSVYPYAIFTVCYICKYKKTKFKYNFAKQENNIYGEIEKKKTKKFKSNGTCDDNGNQQVTKSKKQMKKTKEKQTKKNRKQW